MVNIYRKILYVPTGIMDKCNKMTEERVDSGRN